MTAEQPAYTPAQYLQAGRRAEAEGRIDHAMQFYRFLAEQHGGTPEGADAREGLFRLRSEAGRTAQRPAAAAPPLASTPTLQAPPPPGAPAPAVPTAPPPPHQAPVFSQPAAPSAYPVPVNYGGAPHAEGRLPRAIARHDPDSALLELPPPPDGYFVARIIARLVGLLGWLMLLVGIALCTLMVVGSLYDKRAMAIFATVPMLAWLGPMLLATGAMIGLLSQIARGLFDTAVATRDLAAIERAKAEL
jgi:hypothetical protein